MLLGLLSLCILTLGYSRRQPASLLSAYCTFTVLLHPAHRSALAVPWGDDWATGGGARGLGEGGGEYGTPASSELSGRTGEPVSQGIFYWSEYGPWTTCTATCGTGIEGRRRVCLSERNAEVSSEHCTGSQRQFRLCRIQNCPNSFDLWYRASRCQEIAPPGQRWRPYYPSGRDGYSPCVLACYSDHNHGEIQVVESDVPSGTRCAIYREGVPETGVCIEGFCWSVGCDGYLNSTKYPDRCGVCGGDGSSCTLVTGERISENLQVGYTDLIEIPVGATNIQISEIHSLHTYLSLTQNSGDYFVNGDLRVEADFSKYFHAAGALMRYQRSNIYTGAHWEERESLTARGPTNETLLVQILNFKDGSTCSVTYEYVIPRDVSIETPTQTNTSQLQNFPVETAKSIPKHIAHRPLETLLESDDFSKPLYPVNMTDITDEHYTPQDHLQDSQHLGTDAQAGIDQVSQNQTGILPSERTVPMAIEVAAEQASTSRTPMYHRNRYANSTQSQNATYTDFPDRHGMHTERTPSPGRAVGYHSNATLSPIPREPTHKKYEGEGPPPPPLELPGTSGWAEVASMQRPNNGQIVLDRDSSRGPSSRGRSNLKPGQEDADEGGEGKGGGLVYGPPYRTDDSVDETVSRESGPDITTPETATVELQTDDMRYDDWDDDDEPVIKQHEGDNKVGFESQVPNDLDMSESDYEQDFSSSDVENGLQYTTQAAPPSNDRRRPGATAGSESASNPTTREMTTSAMTTYVATFGATSDAVTTVAATVLPTTTVVTTQPAPTHIWRITATMPCSATCTRGIMRNYAYCVDLEEQQVDDTLCDPRTKPDVIARECAGQPCEPRWVLGAWSNCLGDCDSSYRFRTVHCWLMMGQGMDSTVPNGRCNQTTKPNATMPCDEQDCGPQWIVTEWSRCSASCGQGVETRRVTCSEGSRCDPDQRPEEERSCSVTPCVWSTSSWSQCRGACAVQSRRVFCIAESTNSRVHDRLCGGIDKPFSIQLCGRSHCMAKWIPQAWGQCEGDCTNAYHRRAVVCQGINGARGVTVYADSHCKGTPPISRLRCHKQSCPRQPSPEWVPYHWKPCSVTCGKGTQSRDVRCLVSARAASGCDEATRPVSVQECQRPQCTAELNRGTYVTADDEDPDCQDSEKADCRLIVQASLCRFERYSRQCCRSCRNVAGRSERRAGK